MDTSRLLDECNLFCTMETVVDKQTFSFFQNGNNRKPRQYTSTYLLLVSDSGARGFVRHRGSSLH